MRNLVNTQDLSGKGTSAVETRAEINMDSIVTNLQDKAAKSQLKEELDSSTKKSILRRRDFMSAQKKQLLVTFDEEPDVTSEISEVSESSE